MNVKSVFKVKNVTTPLHLCSGVSERSCDSAVVSVPF